MYSCVRGTSSLPMGLRKVNKSKACLQCWRCNEQSHSMVSRPCSAPAATQCNASERCIVMREHCAAQRINHRPSAPATETIRTPPPAPRSAPHQTPARTQPAPCSRCATFERAVFCMAVDLLSPLVLARLAALAPVIASQRPARPARSWSLWARSCQCMDSNTPEHKTSPVIARSGAPKFQAPAPRARARALIRP